MNSKRLARLAKHAWDPTFAKNALSSILGKAITKFRLHQLERYHRGVKRDFTHIRNSALRRTVTYAYRHCPYYRELFQERGIHLDRPLDNWSLVPFLEKEVIREQRDKLLASKRMPDYLAGLTYTGGSTGQPLAFYRLGSYDGIHQAFLYRLMGYVPGDRILAMDGTLVADKLTERNIFWTNKSNRDLPYGRLALSSQYLTTENIGFYIEFLKEFRPAIIRGYPSFIDLIASYIVENDIDMKIGVKGIQVTSESVADHQVERIGRAFGAPVYNQYGHSEACVFGYSIDDSFTTYCSPLYGFTEVIGDDFKQVAPGDVGEIVVTGFACHAMPFIRYRTGDLALYDGEEDGITRLRRVYGRTQDYVYTADMERVLLTAIIFGRHYEAFDNIRKWQLVQDVPGEITFRIMATSEFSDRDRKELHDNFYDIAKIVTHCELVDSLALTPHGKSKLLVQNVEP